MRSKLASQAPPSAASSVTSSADMLRRLTSMFSPGFLQMRAASDELHSLQQFVRFHATREDVAWAASGTVHCILIVWQISPPQLLHCTRTQLQKVAIWIRNQENKEKDKKIILKKQTRERKNTKDTRPRKRNALNLSLAYAINFWRTMAVKWNNSLSRNPDPYLNMMQEYLRTTGEKKSIFMDTFCLATVGQELTLTICFLLCLDLGWMPTVEIQHQLDNLLQPCSATHPHSCPQPAIEVIITGRCMHE